MEASNKLAMAMNVGVTTLIAFLCVNVVFPLPYSFFRALSSAAVEILILLVISGFVSLRFGKTWLMVSCFLGGIALCDFLHKAHSSDFVYAQPVSESKQLRVAHFQLADGCTDSFLRHQILPLDADVVSLQLPADMDFSACLAKPLRQRYAYQHDFLHETGRIVLFSARPIRRLDTVQAAGQSSLLATLRLDSVSGDVRLLCTALSTPNGWEYDAQISRQLDALTLHLQQLPQQLPLLTLGSSTLATWQPEWRFFKTANTLNDSRFDWHLQHVDAHIFYSHQLECTRFQLHSQGVEGSYQIRQKQPQNI